MRFLALAGGLSALLIGASAHAQPPAEALPETVCLTNACSAPLKLPAAPKTVQEAIATAQAHRVKDLGGTPVDALAAVDTKIRGRLAETPSPDEGLIGYVRSFERFRDISDGSTLTFIPRSTDTPDGLGLLVMGGIERRFPDGRIELMHLLNNGAGRLGVDPSVGR